MPYPPIEDHGIIGGLNTVALVRLDGTIGFMCAPRFDSPTVFASLLDTAAYASTLSTTNRNAEPYAATRRTGVEILMRRGGVGEASSRAEPSVGVSRS